MTAIPAHTRPTTNPIVGPKVTPAPMSATRKTSMSNCERVSNAKAEDALSVSNADDSDMSTEVSFRETLKLRFQRHALPQLNLWNC